MEQRHHRHADQHPRPMTIGLPRLAAVQETQRQSSVHGPLPKVCPCWVKHKDPINSTGDLFLSASSFTLSFLFLVASLSRHMVYRPQYPLGWGARPDTTFHGYSFTVICHQFMVDVVLSLEPETGDRSSTERTRNYTRCGSLPVFTSCSLPLRSPRVLWLPLHALRVPHCRSSHEPLARQFLPHRPPRLLSRFRRPHLVMLRRRVHPLDVRWLRVTLHRQLLLCCPQVSAGTRSTAKGPLLSLRPRVDTSRFQWRSLDGSCGPRKRLSLIISPLFF